MLTLGETKTMKRLLSIEGDEGDLTVNAACNP